VNKRLYRVSKWGLTSRSTYNTHVGHFWRRVFPGSHLHWY